MSDTAAAKRAARLKGLRTAVRTKPMLDLTAVSAGSRRPTGVLHRYRPVFLALAIFMLGSTIAQRRAVSAGDYVLSEHTEDVAVSVSADTGESVSLSMGALGWYVLLVEREGERLAQAYNAEDPAAYWKLRVSTASRGSYISEIARDTVLDYAARDMIYSIEAARQGVGLDEQEKERIYSQAEKEWLNLSERERKATGLDTEAIAEAMEREALLERMAALLFDEGVADINVGSDYYEELKQRYITEYSKDAQQSLRVGYVTIN